MNSEYELLHVRLSGTGGQGVILMGKLLAEATAIHAGFNVVMTKSYGPEARGGACRSDIIICRGEIDALAGTEPNILVCLSQQACNRYFNNAAPPDIFLIDSTSVKVVPTSRAVEVPLTELATGKLQNPMTVNILALGVLGGLINLVEQEALASAIRGNVREQYIDLNLRALALGWELAADLRAKLGQTFLPDYSTISGQTPVKPAGRAKKPARKAAAAALGKA